MHFFRCGVTLIGCYLLWVVGVAIAAESDPAVGPVSTEITVVADFLGRSGLTPVEGLGPEPTLAAYVAYGVLHGQEVRAAVADWQAARETIAQASTLPDPRFTFTEMLVPVETRVGPQQRSFGLWQTFPWFGTLSTGGEVQKATVRAAAARLQGALSRTAFRIKRAYFDLVYLTRAIEVTEAHLVLLSQWEAAARARYETGMVNYNDLVKTQVEMGMLENRLIELQDSYRPLSVQLNAALNRSGDTDVPRPRATFKDNGSWIDASLAGISLVGATLAETALADSLRRYNPELLALRNEAEHFQHAGQLARKKGLPDLTLGLTYIQTGPAIDPSTPDSGKDPVMASLSVSLPLWRGKYRAASQEAESRYLATRASRKEREDALLAKLATAHFGYREARRKVDLYAQGLLPKGRQALQAALAAYEAGSIGYLDVLDAQRTLLEFELAGARAVTEQHIHLAGMEMLVGIPLTLLSQKESGEG
jgi:outer membrane protein TolC